MHVAVLQFPGSNCDQDCVHAVRTLGHTADFLWHKEESLGAADAVIIPGGFSYGDYLRCGAIARFSPVMQAVRRFAAEGGLVLGICNGFQILCEVGLLPGALIRNRSLQFRCEPVFLKTSNRDTPFTRRIPEGRILRVPIAHGEGCYYTAPETLEALEREGRILWRYCDARGEVTEDANPNGSLRNIAGICNAAGNVAGMMPHPERASEAILSNEDGRFILESMLAGRPEAASATA